MILLIKRLRFLVLLGILGTSTAFGYTFDPYFLEIDPKLKYSVNAPLGYYNVLHADQFVFTVKRKAASGLGKLIELARTQHRYIQVPSTFFVSGQVTRKVLANDFKLGDPYAEKVQKVLKSQILIKSATMQSVYTTDVLIPGATIKLSDNNLKAPLQAALDAIPGEWVSVNVSGLSLSGYFRANEIFSPGTEPAQAATAPAQEEELPPSYSSSVYSVVPTIDMPQAR